jgi:hypothetical protein
VLDRYDLKRACLPQFLALLRGEELRVEKPRPPRRMRASLRRRALRRARRQQVTERHSMDASRVLVE